MARTSFWTQLDPEERASLLSAGRTRHFKPGEILMRQGDLSDHILVIRSGWVKIVLAHSDGQEHIMALRGPGDLIGEMGTLGSAPREASVVALHLIGALALSQTRFSAYLSDHPRVWSKVIRVISERLSASDSRIIATSTRPGTERLAAFLLDLAQRNGITEPDGVRLPPLTQTELASCVDTSRETVARALRQWRTDGILSTGWRRTILHDPARLGRYT